MHIINTASHTYRGEDIGHLVTPAQKGIENS